MRVERVGWPAGMSAVAGDDENVAVESVGDLSQRRRGDVNVVTVQQVVQLGQGNAGTFGERPHRFDFGVRHKSPDLLNDFHVHHLQIGKKDSRS